MSFVARFRIVARKFIYFQHRASKLGPSYHGCNERQSACTRRNADPRRGCPNCEWTVQWQTFLKELDAELSKVKGGTREGARRWPRKALLESVYQVIGLANKYKDSEGPNWTVVTSLLVSVFRDERAKKESIDQFNATQAIEQQREQVKGSRGPKPGEYD